MNTRKHKRILQECVGLLEKNGISVDEQFSRLIEFFFSSDHHVSKDDMRRFIKDNGIEIPEMVIQNALVLLKEYGFAVEKRFGDGTVRYEHLHIDEHHDHFYCIKCGRITEFFSPEIEDAQVREARVRGFHIFSHKMQINGLCSRCFGKTRSGCIPLGAVESGGRFKVKEIKENSNCCRKRIFDMGIVTGFEGTVLTNNAGLVVVTSGGGRIALGRGMSQQILVTIEN
ncbi:MAG: transcriptional repressor [Chitinispirillaceae bacterium]